MNKIKIGVIGVSNHLTKRIILPLQQTNNCSIYGIASRNADKAKAFAQQFNIEKHYNNYDILLNDSNIDAVYIPLPNHLHKEWIIKAAKAGKHILCEKPLTLNTEEAEECLSIAKETGVKIMEAFMYPFHPQWIHAKNLVKTNQIGNVQYIQASFAYNNPAENNIRNIKHFGGGSMMDIGCYAVSSARFILDKEPKRVVSLCEEHDRFNTDILSSAILDFNGTHASFSVSTLSEANQFVNIIGTSGMIKMHIPFNAYVDTKARITISTPQGSRDIDFDVCDQYGLMFDEFSDAILNENDTPHSLTNTINNMKVIDAIFKSNSSKRWENLE